MFYCCRWDSKRILSIFAALMMSVGLCLDSNATEGEAPPALHVGPPMTIASPGVGVVATRSVDGTWHAGYFDPTVFHTIRATDPLGPWTNVATRMGSNDPWWNPQIVSLGQGRWYFEITAFVFYPCEEEGEYWKTTAQGQSPDEKCVYYGDNYGVNGVSADDGLTWRHDIRGFSDFSSYYDLDEIFLENYEGQLWGFLQERENWIIMRSFDQSQSRWESSPAINLGELDAQGYLRATGASEDNLFLLVADSESVEGAIRRLNLHYVQSRDGGKTWSKHGIIGPETFIRAPDNRWHLNTFWVKSASTLRRDCVVFPGRLPDESIYSFFVTTHFGDSDDWLAPYPFTSAQVRWFTVEYFDLNGIVILWREWGQSVPEMQLRYILSYDNGQTWTETQELDESFNPVGVNSAPTLFFDSPTSGHMVYTHKPCVDCPFEVAIAPITIAPDPSPVVVTDGEAANALLENYRVLDSDNNGLLSAEEVGQFLLELFPIHLRPEDPVSDLFARMDANNDGFITVAEVRRFIEGPGAVHAADPEARNTITLSSLLRVIQFFNAGGFHCSVTPGDTEDGYAVGPGTQDCTPHSSDYFPQDWRISLSELLRLIQFYNGNGYHACADGEDGFCLGGA